MMPYSEINIGDVFSDPMLRNFGNLSGLEWYVVDKKDRLIKVQAVSYAEGKPVLAPLWKKSSARMFSESWCVLKGFGNQRGYRGD